MNSLYLNLLAIAAANPAGFTYNINTNSYPKSGFSVAFSETQNSFNEDGLKNVVSFALANKGKVNAVGGWYDQESGLYYYDAVIVLNNLDDAIRLGKINNQIAIFDLGKMEEIRILKKDNE